jgi:hypothetical protein
MPDQTLLRVGQWAPKGKLMLHPCLLSCGDSQVMMAWLTPRDFSAWLGSPGLEPNPVLHGSCGPYQARESCVPVGVNGEERQGLGSRGHIEDSEMTSPSSKEVHGIVERAGPFELKKTCVQVLVILLTSCGILGKSHYHSQPPLPHV